MKTATLINDDLGGFTGSAKLYKVNPPVEYDDGDKSTLFIVASATAAAFSGSETFLFPADGDGNVVDWGALESSCRGGLDCDKAIEGAGYILEGAK